MQSHLYTLHTYTHKKQFWWLHQTI